MPVVTRAVIFVPLIISLVKSPIIESDLFSMVLLCASVFVLTCIEAPLTER